jgi:hypothetical protein
MFELYDGEQHAPATLIRDFLAVWKQPLGAVNPIADAMYQVGFRRLDDPCH